MIVCSTYSRPFLHLRVQMLLLCSTIFTHISGRQNTFVKKKLSQNYISLFFLATNGWEEALLTLLERKVHFLPLKSAFFRRDTYFLRCWTDVEGEWEGWAKNRRYCDRHRMNMIIRKMQTWSFTCFYVTIFLQTFYFKTSFL